MKSILYARSKMLTDNRLKEDSIQNNQSSDANPKIFTIRDRKILDNNHIYHASKL